MLCTTTWAPSTPGWGLHPSAAQTQRRATVSSSTTTLREKDCRTSWSASLKQSLSKSTAPRSRWRLAASPVSLRGFRPSHSLFAPVCWWIWGYHGMELRAGKLPNSRAGAALLTEVRAFASCLSQRRISGMRSFGSLKWVKAFLLLFFQFELYLGVYLSLASFCFFKYR